MKKNKKNTKKLLLIFYILAVILGLYNLYIKISAWNLSMVDVISEASPGSTLFIVCWGLILFVFSIIIIRKIIRDKLPKINFIYPIYFISFIFLYVILTIILVSIYGSTKAATIYSEFYHHIWIIYVWDVIFPSFMIYHQFIRKKMRRRK